MKHVLLTAATAAEIEPFTRFLQVNYPQPAPGLFRQEEQSIQVLISGVGMMATAFSLASCMAQQPFDAAIQAGIGGSFDPDIPLGTVVGIASETYGDLGAEDHEDYIDIFTLGFLDARTYPFSDGKLTNNAPLAIAGQLPMVDALSVNTVSGSAATIAARNSRYRCTVESMEGIAFHYACLKHQVPFLQVRAISNYVTPRDRSSWQIGPALHNLNQFLQQTFTNVPF